MRIVLLLSAIMALGAAEGEAAAPQVTLVYPATQIQAVLTGLETQRAAAAAEWTALLRDRAAEIAVINGAGGLQEDYDYDQQQAAKYRGRPVEGIHIRGAMYFNSPLVIALDTRIHLYRAYLGLLGTGREHSGSWPAEVKYAVEHELRVAKDLADYELLQRAMIAPAAAAAADEDF